MRDATAGDPVTGLKWTHKSLRAIGRELARCLPTKGYIINRKFRNWFKSKGIGGDPGSAHVDGLAA